MNVAVDGGTWTNGRGYGRFTRELLCALAARRGRHRFSVVIDSSVPGELEPPMPAFRVKLSAAPSVAASAAGSRSAADLLRMSRALTAQHADCFFFPSVYTYVPLATRRPIVVCIHDVIAESFPSYIFPNQRARLFWTLKTRAAVRQASRIVTVSRHARDGIVKHFGLAAETVGVVPEAPAEAFGESADAVLGRQALVNAGLPANARFLLYVGGIAPHKNLTALVDAFAALRKQPRYADLALVMVGDYTGDVFHSAYPEVRQQVDRLGDGAAVFTGALPDDAVAGLMRISEALVLPSLDEGYGLPGIEAAACGAPVVATCNSALPDVLGDGALYFNPADPPALQQVLERLLSDPDLGNALRKSGAERARAQTWAHAADALLEVFDELAEAPSQ